MEWIENAVFQRRFEVIDSKSKNTKEMGGRSKAHVLKREETGRPPSTIFLIQWGAIEATFHDFLSQTLLSLLSVFL